MESVNPLESLQPNLLIVGILAGFVIAWIALSGLWMKVANYYCGGAPVGMLRATVAVLVSAVLACLASTFAIVLQPNDPSYVSLIYATFGSVIGISLVLAQNPIRAFMVHIVCTVLQILSAIGFVIAFIVLVSIAIPAERLKEIGAELSERSTQVKFAPVENPFKDSQSMVKGRDELDSLMFGPPVKSVKASSDAKERSDAGSASVAPARVIPKSTGNPSKALPPGMQANPFAQ